MERFFEELAELFGRMDEAYTQAAAAHGFVCAGCEKNCCRSIFYHHTLAEYLFLRQGLAELPQAEQQRVRRKAAEAAALPTAGPAAVEARAMCPLNEKGRCLLYAHRPMICRLHGIPHHLRRPDGRRLAGPGCSEFESLCGADQPALLDRTPLYAGLAELEKRMRSGCRFEGRIKMTVAQMIVERLPGSAVVPLTGERLETP